MIGNAFSKQIEDSVVVGKIDKEGHEYVVIFVKMVSGLKLTPQIAQSLKVSPSLLLSFPLPFFLLSPACE